MKLNGEKIFGSPVSLPPGWYVVGRWGRRQKRRLRRGVPLTARLAGQSFVLFPAFANGGGNRGGRNKLFQLATDGRVLELVALPDFCPHRQVPLSAGRLRQACGPEGAHHCRIQCGYHGWEFDARGKCVRVPGRRTEPALELTPRPARVADGLLFLYWPGKNPSDRDADQARESFTIIEERLRYSREQKGSRTDYQADLPASLVDTAENILDVPHTSFLHGGLFRGQSNRTRVDRPRQTLEVELEKLRVGKRFAGWQADYRGEKSPGGLLARFLRFFLPGTLRHQDRFWRPGLAEVEYRLGRYFLYIQSWLQPLEARKTRLWARVYFRLPLPHFLILPVARWLGIRVARQDQQIFQRAWEPIPKLPVVSTEIDGIGRRLRGNWEILCRGELPADNGKNTQGESGERYQLDVF